jgi:hypothetical protein
MIHTLLLTSLARPTTYQISNSYLSSCLPTCFCHSRDLSEPCFCSASATNRPSVSPSTHQTRKTFGCPQPCIPTRALRYTAEPVIIERLDPISSSPSYSSTWTCHSTLAITVEATARRRSLSIHKAATMRTHSHPGLLPLRSISTSSSAESHTD